LRIHYERLAEVAKSNGMESYAVVAKARPSDIGMTAPREGQEQCLSPRGTIPEEWGPAACAFCANRPKDVSNIAGNKFWWYGNGNGAHNPYRCACLKRYLCEGGDTTNDAAYAAKLRACVYIPKYNKK
jgi:hypothetical protein